jgi:hypothetical protein
MYFAVTRTNRVYSFHKGGLSYGPAQTTIIDGNELTGSIVELFESSLLTAKDFTSYCQEKYKSPNAN